MSKLIDELRADSKTGGSTCSFCAWIAMRPVAERQEWKAIITDRSFTVASIFRAAKRRGYTFTESPVHDHRKRGHS